jgi:hypothetical protein
MSDAAWAAPFANSTFPHTSKEDDNADPPIETRPGDNTLDDQPMDMEEDNQPSDIATPHSKTPTRRNTLATSPPL